MCFCTINRKKWLGLLVVLSCFACFLVLKMPKALADRILAVVGNEVITENELNKLVKLWEYEISSDLSNSEAMERWRSIKQKALERLIEDRLLYLEALSEGIKVAPERVEAEIQKLKSRFKTEQDFLNSLRQMHITPQDLYNQIEKQLMIRKLILKDIRSKIYINPVEVARAFQYHKDKFCLVKRVKVDSVFIPRSQFKNLSEMEFDSLVMDEYMKLNSGKLTWRDLETKFGRGEISGWKTPGDLAPKISASLFSEKVEVYPLPVKVSTGYYLFRVEKREKDCPKRLIDARERVYNYLFQKKFSKMLDSYIKNLRSKFYVKVYKEV